VVEAKSMELRLIGCELLSSTPTPPLHVEPQAVSRQEAGAWSCVLFPQPPISLHFRHLTLPACLHRPDLARKKQPTPSSRCAAREPPRLRTHCRTLKLACNQNTTTVSNSRPAGAAQHHELLQHAH
jgi:hypothetical protein